MKLTATYDSAGRIDLWQYTKPDHSVVAKWHYGRDVKGLPVKIQREDNYTVYYTYDAADRLTQEHYLDGSGFALYQLQYAYDQSGNRVRMMRDTDTTYYHYDAGNRLTKTTGDAGGAYYRYDDNGSLTWTTGTYFEYNAAGLVARIIRPGNTTAFYYDGNLQRYAMDENGTLSYFLWDGLNILQERDASGAVKVENANCKSAIPGIAQLVESYRPSETDQKIYPVMDVRGSITKWVNADGTTVAASREYDAFGVVLDSAGTWPSRFGYQGQAWIELKNRSMLSPTRIYDNEAGIFLAADGKCMGWETSDDAPIASLINLYAWNVPTNTVDPDGQWLRLACCLYMSGRMIYKAAEALGGGCAGLYGVELLRCIAESMIDCPEGFDLVSCLSRARSVEAAIECLRDAAKGKVSEWAEELVFIASVLCCLGPGALERLRRIPLPNHNPLPQPTIGMAAALPAVLNGAGVEVVDGFVFASPSLSHALTNSGFTRSL